MNHKSVSQGPLGASINATEPAPTPAQQRLVRMAARALGRAGLVHAYGHCSLRLDAQHFLVCAAKPMGLVGAVDAGRIFERMWDYLVDGDEELQAVSS